MTINQILNLILKKDYITATNELKERYKKIKEPQILLLLEDIKIKQGDYMETLANISEISKQNNSFNVDLDNLINKKSNWTKTLGFESCYIHFLYLIYLFKTEDYKQLYIFSKSLLDRFLEHRFSVLGFLDTDLLAYYKSMELVGSFLSLFALDKLNKPFLFKQHRQEFLELQKNASKSTKESFFKHLSSFDKNPDRLILEWELKYPKKISKSEIINLLAPEQFVSKKRFAKKSNQIKSKNPLVSVCIASYKDGQWLQTTVDSILSNSGYDNFEIIVVLQKLALEEDITGDFLEEEKYKNNPKIKVFRYNHLLGADGAKQKAIENHSKGEIICTLDAHTVINKDAIKKAVKHFVTKKYLHILSFNIVQTKENKKVEGYYFDESPKDLNGIIGTGPCKNQNKISKNWYKRLSLIGCGAFITKQSFLDSFGYQLLPDHSWGDKLLGMNSYIYGYDIFVDPNIVCIHKWHSVKSNYWIENTRKSDRFEYQHNLGASSLKFAFVLFSTKYFEEYFLPYIKNITKDNFENQYNIFLNDIERLKTYKKKFWQNAVRSVEDYWLQYWDVIYSKMTIDQKIHLCKDFDCPELNSEMQEKELEEFEQKKEEGKDSHKNLEGGNIKTISPEWIKWIKDSLDSGVSFIKILELMLKNGFEEEFAINEIRKEEGKEKELKQVFTRIYENNVWGSSESRSGLGSELKHTETIRQELPKVFKKFNIKTFLDIPCGDFNWMSKVNFEGVKYTGADIVENLIDNNKNNFKDFNFKVLDLTKDELPKVDMLFVREVLGHFDYNNINKAIDNIVKSGSKYLLTTSFTRWTNTNVENGGWRPINLMVEPFNMKPIYLINENSLEGGSNYNDKCLLLFEIDKIIDKKNSGNIKTISPEWIKWIKDSLDSGVSFIKILELMLKNGFEEEFAIDQIRKEQKIDTERQTLNLDDLIKAHKNKLTK